MAGRLSRIEEFEEFALAKGVIPTDVNAAIVETVCSLDEREEMEPYLRQIISDFGQTPHGPAELVDIFTHRLTKSGTARLAAFIVKGRSFRTVRPSDVAHQIYRLEKIDGLDVAVFAAPGVILDQAKEQFISTARRVASEYVIADAVDLGRVFIAHGFLCPRDGRRIVAGRCICGYSPVKRLLNVFQREALRSLQDSHRRNESAGLVVLPPGAGKTRVAAEDALRSGARHILYVAHTYEILDVARSEFEAKFSEAAVTQHDSVSLAKLNTVNLVTIQLLNRHLHRTDLAAFDYVVVDEFHHAAAATYRKAISAIRPRYLLGMTATPFRGDNQDVLELCGNNQLVSFDLRSGIDSGILSAYHYYGCFDDIDYSQITYRHSAYDIRDLERALLIPERDEAIINKWRELGDGKPTLAFCCTHEHALRMARSFESAGVPAAAYISLTSQTERSELTERLGNGDLSVLCVVDIFNEGADLPFIECLLFLRPTESKRIFYQQLGRGLRQYAGKRHCTVVDFIGDFRNAYRIVEYHGLLPLDEADPVGSIRSARSRKELLNLPLGCEVHFEERVLDIFAQQTHDDPRHATRHNIARILYYQYDRLRRFLGRKPTKKDVNRNLLLGTDLYRLVFGSWAAFERLVEKDD